MARHNQTGKTGEAMAAGYCTLQGFRILYQNWRFGRLEVDIIAEKGGILHFIEVKTRRSSHYGNPEDSVTPKKIRHLMEAAEEFLEQYPGWQRIQFDVLAITLLPGKKEEYFFIEDVFV